MSVPSPVRRMTRCALMGALIAVLSPLALPMGPVPFTLGWLAVLLSATLQPMREATLSVALYIAVGAVGLPVFAGVQGGLGVLLGPLGGYLWGYLLLTPFMAWIIGILRTCVGTRRAVYTAICLIMSTILCHLCGNIQYCFVQGAPFFASLAVTSLPFLIPDVGKCLLVTWLSPRLARLLDRQA